MKSCIVVPTNRPERIVQFIEAWAPQFHRPDVRLIIVEDAPAQTVKLPPWVEHYSHADINERLGDKAECIPVKSGGCRDFGFWLAYQDTTIDMVVSLDDDVLPLEGVDFLAEHWEVLEEPYNLRWWPLFPGFRLRGEPYSVEAVKSALNLGLWFGYPDVDAFGQLTNPKGADAFGLQRPVATSGLIPPSMYYPQCGMNWACRRDAIPFTYFPKLPDGMKRFDDIWSGLIFKRIADVFNWPVTTGKPCVMHDRASNPLSNLRQEMLGYGINEELWKVVDGIQDVTPLEMYRKIANILGKRFPQLRETARLMLVWASLFEEA